ncbi:MAG: helix-turn-helix domain-containing protein [Tistlia sp.]|uniref:helix-turn-helix domain-containing protein n=1 Tax=Tistlia sp. TaxID=3057121 RepID=UPI0034A5BE6E
MESVQKRTMTVPEAGREFLNVSERRAYQLAEEGVIPTVRVGRKLIVPIAAMEQRFAEMTEQALKGAAEHGEAA